MSSTRTVTIGSSGGLFGKAMSVPFATSVILSCLFVFSAEEVRADLCARYLFEAACANACSTLRSVIICGYQHHSKIASLNLWIIYMNKDDPVNEFNERLRLILADPTAF